MVPEGSGHGANRLVAAQLLAVAVVAWPGAPRWRLPRPVAALAGVTGALGTALIEESLRFIGSDLTPSVEPRRGARLHTTGPYAVSRNPMYAGLLVATAAAAVLRRRPEPLLGWVALAAVLHVKTGREEERLRERFGVEYEEYAARTPRLLALPHANRPR